HGGQSIPAFDYYMAPGVLHTFKKQFKQRIYDFLDLFEYLDDVNLDTMMNKVDKLSSIDITLDDIEEIADKDKTIQNVLEKAYEKALLVTDRITYQAMEAFIHNLNTMHSRAGAQVPFSSINFGTDISS